MPRPNPLSAKFLCACGTATALFGCVGQVSAQGCPISFLPRTVVPSSAGSYAVIAADLNGDGLCDIATANSSANNISFWLDGDGGFSPASFVGSPGSPSGAACGQFNAEQGTDLAVTGFTSNAVYVHPQPALNGVPRTPIAYAAGPQPFGVVSADFNTDGRADLAVSNFGASTVSVLLANATGGFDARRAFNVGSANLAIAVGDFNGDGLPDLAVPNFNSGTVSILRNTGGGNFAAHTTHACGGAPRGVVAADFNGDGLDDLAVCSNSDGTVSTLINAGNGTFLARQIWPCGTSPQSISVGDLNNDGILDLAIPNYNTNTVSVLTGIGGGIFRPRTQFAAGSQPTSVSIADANRDGLPDLLVSTFAGELSILINSTPAARILHQPQSQSSPRGASAVFQVEAVAISTAQPTYRWHKDGVALTDGPGMTGTATNVLTLPRIDDSFAGSYRVRISTPCGSLLSDPAILIADPCYADTDGSSVIDLIDLLEFVQLWHAGCP